MSKRNGNASSNEQSESQSPPDTANGSAEGGATADKRERWHKVQTDRGLYSGERGKGDPVIGYLLGILDMPPVLGKPFRAFIVRLTEPCRAKREKKEYVAEVGEEILMPFNHQLATHCAKAAMHPTLMFEVSLTPTGQRKSSQGQMTTWEILVNPQGVRRSGADRLLAMQSAAPSLPAQAGGGEDEPEIPFE